MSWNLILVLIMWLNVALLKDMVNGECEHLPVVINSSNNATHSGPYSDGEIIAYTCHENFSTLDYPFYKCVGNAFVGNVSCTECKCKEPDTTDKHIIVHNKNCHIAFACSLGYTCHGQASLFCRPDGRLSPSQPPECKPVPCGSYGTVENGHITIKSDTENNTVFGSTGMIECNDGYLLDGEKYFTCQADGTWSAKGRCKSFSCPAFSGIQSRCVEKTHISANNYYIKCRDDVPTTDIGETTSPMKCLGSKWLNQSRSCFCHCDIRDLEKQIVIHGLEDVSYIPHGYVLNWTCANGTKDNKVRDEQIMCCDGKFNYQPHCLVDLNVNDHNDNDENFQEDTNDSKLGTNVVIIAVVPSLVIVSALIVYVLRKKRIRVRRESPSDETRDNGIRNPANNPLLAQTDEDSRRNSRLASTSCPDTRRNGQRLNNVIRSVTNAMTRVMRRCMPDNRNPSESENENEEQALAMQSGLRTSETTGNPQTRNGMKTRTLDRRYYNVIAEMKTERTFPKQE